MACSVLCIVEKNCFGWSICDIVSSSILINVNGVF
jgi:hypothetical protein